MVETITTLCIHCKDVKRLTVKKIIKTAIVQGEEVSYEAQEHICTSCGNKTIVNSKMSDANFVSLYNEYRKLKGYLMPAEIKHIREKLYNMTPNQFAKHIRCTTNILIQVERGCLQSKELDDKLKEAQKIKCQNQ